jgi:ribose 5-phosphate isomerase B
MPKRFTIITETDARTFERGETIILARHGHVTPLAADTLHERRVTMLREDEATADEASLVPVADIRRVAIGSDQSGIALRKALLSDLRGRGLSVLDQGTDGPDPVDYPDIAAAVALAVVRGEADAGIIIDGAGIGSAIAANKIPGARAAMAQTPIVARYAREHNGANILTLGAALIGESDAREIVSTWLTTPMREPRYIRRLLKIRALERRAWVPGTPGDR